METKEYFEKVMHDYNQNRKGRNLRKYCSDEGIDYKWLVEYKRNYGACKPSPLRKRFPISTLSFHTADYRGTF